MTDPVPPELFALTAIVRDAEAKRPPACADPAFCAIEARLLDLEVTGSRGQRTKPWLSVVSDRADHRPIATLIGTTPLEMSAVASLAPDFGVTIEMVPGGWSIVVPGKRVPAPVTRAPSLTFRTGQNVLVDRREAKAGALVRDGRIFLFTETSDTIVYSDAAQLRMARERRLTTQTAVNALTAGPGKRGNIRTRGVARK